MEADDLLYWLRPGQPVLPPVVLLHGSGQDETALLGFAEQACPGHPLVAVRGRVAWEGGFAFFRRNPDRSLDRADLARGAAALQGLLRHLADEGQQPPVLLGYSNGSVAALAALTLEPALSAGAALLRPLSPMPERQLPGLDGYPVLLVAARDDVRRAPGDAPTLHGQLSAAGAASTLVVLPTGHALSDGDGATVRTWVADLVRDGARTM